MKTILLCGNSILIAGLAASLRDIPELTIIQQAVPELLKLEGLSLIVVDAAQIAEVLASLPTSSTIPVVSIDSESNSALVFSTTPCPVGAVQDIVALIADLLTKTNLPKDISER